MQFIDLQTQYRALKTEIDAGIQEVVASAKFIGGPQVKQLEGKLAEATQRKHCISCANGTDALQLAYMLLGVGAGDAVFCPDITFISSTEPAKMLGATSVFCDIDPRTYTLCPESLERQIKAVLAEGKLTPKAVVAVDILGNPCDYDAIVPICEKYSLPLIEDAAQSFGASYKGRPCGSFGLVAITSFFPAKPLGCYGDGGALFTDDDALADVCRSLCVHGKGPGGKYDNIRVNHQLRFGDTVRTLKAEVEAGYFGKLLHGTVQVRRNRNRAYYDAAKWRGTWAQDGGALMNQCIHYTDLLQWFMGSDVDEVMAYTDRLTHPYIETEDLGLALVKFKNGAYGVIEGTVNVYPKNLSDSLALFGETGTVSLSGKILDEVQAWSFEKGPQSRDEAVDRLSAPHGRRAYAVVWKRDRCHRAWWAVALPAGGWPKSAGTGIGNI